jgi:hypothetical protein
MRQNKEPTVIGLKKYEEPKLHFHCSSPGHDGVRLLEIPGKGYWCPLGCGPSASIPAIRTVLTLNDPSTGTFV